MPTTVQVTDSNGNVVSSGQLTAVNEWVEIKSIAMFVADANNKGLTISAPGYSGALMIDHVHVVPQSTYDDCVQIVEFEFDAPTRKSPSSCQHSIAHSLILYSIYCLY